MADPQPLRLGARTFGPDELVVMAIVNRTPDSFFAGARTFGLDAALERVDQAVAQGAGIIDVGGVKAGPGDEVDEVEEARRVIDLIAAIRARHSDIVISVDTFRSSVADRACQAGADLVNDAWGGWDPDLAAVAAAHGAGIVCTHAGGLKPRTRPHRVEYDDVVGHVIQSVTDLAQLAVDAGVDRSSIIIDPGHDFGKNSHHSMLVTRRLDELVETGWPVLVALSRKDFIGEALDLPPDDRLEGTLAATAVSAWLGARVFRAHDVEATTRVLRTVAAIRGTANLAAVKRGLA
ncbi:MAG: dihydropteroate synthase [Candidatus Nanopelagicales bacterium]|nr:dihydropteroate synthase [Candidatus Nanopelagicales bacterium]MDP4906013.1 dihydropteroate synthase [Candidatus Nanopelagicales bacterium]MDP4974642.1 dihydropteroate synthase [Candidatus Nanopelagicales bacterium]MDP5095912.1 dihydropteroate synthase [Candidatus Nanopelagicales bacterium]